MEWTRELVELGPAPGLPVCQTSLGPRGESLGPRLLPDLQIMVHTGRICRSGRIYCGVRMLRPSGLCCKSWHTLTVAINCAAATINSVLSGCCLVPGNEVDAEEVGHIFCARDYALLNALMGLTAYLESTFTGVFEGCHLINC